MKWRILVSAPYLLSCIDRYRSVFAAHDSEIVLPIVNERLTEAELLGLVGDIDGVVAGDDSFTRRVLEKATPRLKVISKWGTGIDAFDQKACQDLGVAIRNTLDAFIDPVADSVMGYILSFARQIPWMDRQMKGGAWDKKPGRALNETTLGIIGVGRIGKAVVHRAQAFGMRVVGNDTATMPPEFLEETGLEMVTKEKLLCQADFVTLTCDLNPTSHHLMDRGAFALMKPNAVLVNTARGQIVDEHALVESLLEGKIGGAGLDVFEDEPLPSQSPLRQMDNVLLAPHNSNSSPRAWTRVHERTLSNLFEVLEGAAK